MTKSEKYYLAFWLLFIVLSIFTAVSCKPMDCAEIDAVSFAQEWRQYRSEVANPTCKGFIEWLNPDTLYFQGGYWVQDSTWRKE